MLSIQDRIPTLLHMGNSCPCGKPHPVSLSSLVMEAGGLAKLPQVIQKLGNFSHVVMVCDNNTYTATGQTVEKLCQLSQVVCLPTPAHGALHADETAVEKVESLMGTPDLLIAVGSGTIHDITRYVATKHHLDFVSVPTAASVDGFLSSIAAMTWQGVKRSFPAKPPVALVADSLVLANAPERLTASGVGDLLGKYVCLFDWKASHLITGEYICPQVVSLVEEAVSAVVENAQAVARRDMAAVEAVMYGLVLSGLAMQMVGNSRPASGAEHHVSHLIEMEVLRPTQGNTALHGEKVGVASVLVAQQYHQILAIPQAQLSTTYQGLPLSRIQAVFGEKTNEILTCENTPDPLADIPPAQLIQNWDNLRDLAQNTLPSGQHLAQLLTLMGAPSTLADIGLSPDLWEALWEMSPYVRRRLTMMRLAKLVNM